MIGWSYRIIVIFFIITVAYIILGTYGRWRERQRLESEYTANPASENMDIFVAKGLKKYDRSAKPKLILGVYVVPIAVFGVLLYLAHL